VAKPKKTDTFDKKQATIIAVVGLGVFALMIAAAYFGQKSSGSSTQGGATKRFTAKAGTTRENARVLTSKRAPTEESGNSGSGDDSKPLDSWRDPKTGKPVSEAPKSEAEQLAEDATEGLPTEDGIRQLEDALIFPRDQEGSTRLKVALAKLYARLDDVGVDKALATYDEALANAPTPALRDYVAQESAKMLMQRDEPELAQERLTAALAEAAPPSLPRLQLGLLLGKLQEKKGANTEAESIYKRTLEEGLSLLGAQDERVRGVVRLTGMRLSALYRSSDRAVEAEQVAERVKVFLGT
jgi:tetratricopeptide (TPR) repeat protein